MKIKYKQVDTTTIKGLIHAEHLQRTEWIIYNMGFSTIHFYKKEKQNDYTKTGKTIKTRP